MSLTREQRLRITQKCFGLPVHLSRCPSGMYAFCYDGLRLESTLRSACRKIAELSKIRPIELLSE